MCRTRRGRHGTGRAGFLAVVAAAVIGMATGAAGAASRDAGQFLWVLHNTLDPVGDVVATVALLDADSGEIMCELPGGPAGMWGVDLFSLGSAATERTFVLAQTSAPATIPTGEEARGLQVSISSLAGADGVIDVPQGVVPGIAMTVINAIPVPSLNRIYLNGFDGSGAARSVRVQFTSSWEARKQIGAALPYAWTLSPDQRVLWGSYERRPVDVVRAVDLVSGKTVREVAFPDGVWRGGPLVVSAEGTVLVQGSRSADDGTPDMALFVVGSNGGGLERFETPRFACLGCYDDERKGVWVLTGYGAAPAAELRSAVDGSALIRLSLRDWSKAGPPRSWTILEGGKCIALTFTGSRVDAGYVALLRPETHQVKYVDSATGVVAAVAAHLSDSAVQKLREHVEAARPRPFIPLALPEAGDLDRFKIAWGGADVRLVPDRLRRTLLPEWLPGSFKDDVIRLRGWPPLPDAGFVKYSICSHNEVPSWRLDFQWLVNLDPRGDPVMRGQFSGAGRWMNPLYTDAEEAKEDESLVYSAARYLLAFPHRESHPSPDVTEVSVEMPPFRKYPPGTSDGLPCFRSWLGDLWVYSWVERTKPPTVNYQFTHREKEEHAH